MARIRAVNKPDWGIQQDAWLFGCALYVVQEDQCGPLRVGIAEHPLRRLSTLQCGNPRVLSLRAIYCGSRADCRRIERAITDIWSHTALRGSWLDAELGKVLADIEAEAAA